MTSRGARRSAIAVNPRRSDIKIVASRSSPPSSRPSGSRNRLSATSSDTYRPKARRTSSWARASSTFFSARLRRS